MRSPERAFGCLSAVSFPDVFVVRLSTMQVFPLSTALHCELDRCLLKGTLRCRGSFWNSAVDNPYFGRTASAQLADHRPPQCIVHVVSEGSRFATELSFWHPYSVPHCGLAARGCALHVARSPRVPRRFWKMLRQSVWARCAAKQRLRAVPPLIFLPRQCADARSGSFAGSFGAHLQIL